MNKLVFSLIFWLSGILPGISHAESPKEVTFLAYNLENYLRTESQVPEAGSTLAPKPEKSISALVEIIAAEKPDLIGVCEMGPVSAFRDFLDRLKKAGLDFPFTEFVQAMDEERHVAFASRFPIVARNSQTDLSFDLDGRKQYFKRGILDVTVKISENSQLHFLGTHLKSRREVSENQALLRRNEAHLLRLHAKAILDKAPAEKLLVYGDLNDTINEAPIREIIGRKNSSSYLLPVDLRDVNGEKWTHYWKTADSYSRIDYVLTSPALTPDVIREKSHLASPPHWNEASDHRALVVVIRTLP